MEINNCKNCAYFRTLYRRANYQFFVYKFGDCFKRNIPVECDSCCEFWTVQVVQESISPRVLKRVVYDLEEIKSLLLEEKERIEKNHNTD